MASCAQSIRTVGAYRPKSHRASAGAWTILARLYTERAGGRLGQPEERQWCQEGGAQADPQRGTRVEDLRQESAGEGADQQGEGDHGVEGAVGPAEDVGRDATLAQA